MTATLVPLRGLWQHTQLSAADRHTCTPPATIPSPSSPNCSPSVGPRCRPCARVADLSRQIQSSHPRNHAALCAATPEPDCTDARGLSEQTPLSGKSARTAACPDASMANRRWPRLRRRGRGRLDECVRRVRDWPGMLGECLAGGIVKTCGSACHATCWSSPDSSSGRSTSTPPFSKRGSCTDEGNEMGCVHCPPPGLSGFDELESHRDVGDPGAQRLGDPLPAAGPAAPERRLRCTAPRHRAARRRCPDRSPSEPRRCPVRTASGVDPVQLLKAR
jgi:hypothetical protein